MRQLKALCVVLALLLVIPAIDAVMGVSGAGGSTEQAFAHISAARVSDAKDLDELASRVEALAAGADEAPWWFVGELGLLPEARDVRVSGSVVGYVVDVDAPQALREVRELVSDRGWSCVSMDEIDAIACVKDSGACTWALVTCTQVGAATSVVARCNAA